MDSVNKTLYIPLYGKASVSRQGILLHVTRRRRKSGPRRAFP